MTKSKSITINELKKKLDEATYIIDNGILFIRLIGVGLISSLFIWIGMSIIKVVADACNNCMCVSEAMGYIFLVIGSLGLILTVYGLIIILCEFVFEIELLNN